MEQDQSTLCNRVKGAAMKLPRIKTVSPEGATALRIQWKGGGAARVDLAGWIATGGDMLAALSASNVFRCAAPSDYGSAVAWDDDDLRIDAVHLAKLAEEQQPFGSREAADWQASAGLSNHEAADMLGVSVSTWNTYKAGSTVPVSVAIACRAALRDPILMQAHYRPRRAAGRPRKNEAKRA